MPDTLEGRQVRRGFGHLAQTSRDPSLVGSGLLLTGSYSSVFAQLDGILRIRTHWLFHGVSAAFLEEMIRTTGCMRHIILHPSCLQRVLWDIMSLIVVSFDVLTLPLSAFRFDELDAAATLRLMTTVFWTVDIFITFITGYHEGGVVVGIPTRIARRYIMRLFALDVTIVTVDVGRAPRASATEDPHVRCKMIDLLLGQFR